MRHASRDWQARDKPGTFARRLGSVLRGLVWTMGALFVAAYLLIYVSPMPKAPPPPPEPESTRVNDREGRLLYDFAGPSETHHTHVALSDLPRHLLHAIIATEDGRFFAHRGVDPGAIGRAVLDNILHLEARSGASTITQQLARNLYFDPEERTSSSPRRKIKEAALALRLEREYSKDEILEMYVNRVYLGNHAYGVEAASRTYFAKGSRNLDLAEASLLAGMLQGPSRYDPFLHLSAAKARQRVVLGLMAEDGYVSAAEAAAAAAESLTLSRAQFPIQTPHLVEWQSDQQPKFASDEELRTSVAQLLAPPTEETEMPLQSPAANILVRSDGGLFIVDEAGSEGAK